MTGLYIDNWRIGLHSPKEIDDAYSFCDKAGITDVYIRYQEDIAAKNNWDKIGYALEKRGDKRIHLWRSTTLGRNNQYTKDEATAKQLTTCSDKRDYGTVLAIDTKCLKAQDLLVAEITDLVTRYPDIYGFHLDKFTEDSGEMISKIRAVTQGKHLSATIAYGKDYGWNVDELVPLFVGFNKTQFDNVDISGKRIALGCYSCSLPTTTTRIKRIRGLGGIPILYSYGVFSWNPQDTHADFIAAINA